MFCRTPKRCKGPKYIRRRLATVKKLNYRLTYRDTTMYGCIEESNYKRVVTKIQEKRIAIRKAPSST